MAEIAESSVSEGLTRLPFSPVTKQHILNCSYHSWHPRYRKITPKARLIPLSDPFLHYLRADGIVLPPDDEPQHDWSDDDSGIFSSTENPDAAEDDEDDADPSAEWRDVHDAIKSTIAELGGKVVPKLNWSAPKDATWINATNSMECRSPSDIYLLLKSSDFVTHDLEHAFDDTEEDSTSGTAQTDPTIPYHLVLRKNFLLNPSLEFRCFVRGRRLLAITQRDLNHFDFLFPLIPTFRSRIQSFFDDNLRDSFPDPSFVFDVYLPPPHVKVWLVDVNPWAQRTDPLLFSWLELLTMEGPDEWEKKHKKHGGEEEVMRIPIRPSQPAPEDNPTPSGSSADHSAQTPAEESDSDISTAIPSDNENEEDADEELWLPEIRLVKKDDPEAYSFASPQFSAHKLPRDVVDASRGGESAMREFAERWKEVLAKAQQEDGAAESSDDDE